MALSLDAALKERLRAVLDSQGVTEAELRNLFEEGEACVRILGGDLERSERELAELTADPTSSLAEIADAFRRVSEVGPDLEELRALLGRLETRAREVRASWVRA
jgi:hypothetical protein